MEQTDRMVQLVLKVNKGKQEPLAHKEYKAIPAQQDWLARMVLTELRESRVKQGPLAHKGFKERLALRDP